MRKINRGGQRDSNEPFSEQQDGPVVLPTSQTFLGYHDARFGRSGSEPTEQLLSSIPFHLRSKQRPPQPLFKRNVSDAEPRLPGELERPKVLAEELDDLSDMADTRGLSLWYNPKQPLLNLVFIHGLGGSSLKTWSFGRQTRNFWPL